MSQKRGGCLGGGCLMFLVGLLMGVALTLVSLFFWSILRPVDRAPLANRLPPEELDLEVTVSEAFLNKAVAVNLADHQPEDPDSIILDLHRAGRLEAILEGAVRVAGFDALSPTLDAELSLGVEDGGLVVRVERVGMGALQFARDSLPEITQPTFEAVEETIEFALNERLLVSGYQILSIDTSEDSLTAGLRQW